MGLDHLLKDLEQRENERKKDKEKFEELNEAVCQICHATGEDKRSIFFSCFYDVKEVVPEFLSLQFVEPYNQHQQTQGLHYLRVCKACRGELLGYFKKWRDERAEMRNVEKDHDGHPDQPEEGKDIPVRVHGALKFVSEEEYYKMKREIDEQSNL